jgi:hypothetical protein
VINSSEATTSSRSAFFIRVSARETSGGRQQNRRVELLVSGEAIGSQVNATTGSMHLSKNT